LSFVLIIISVFSSVFILVEKFIANRAEKKESKKEFNIQQKAVKQNDGEQKSLQQLYLTGPFLQQPCHRF
jgi:FtsZ-interacting cell division protein ZipA